jgi:FKBP-type peptidyl-prolyl cis-trans isomerase FklB
VTGVQTCALPISVWQEQNKQAFENQSFEQGYNRFTSITDKNYYVLYKQIVPGSGRQILYTDNVELFYEGRLIDGKVFGVRDSLYDLPQNVAVSSASATYSTTNTGGSVYIMPGIETALQNMKVGEEGELWIPTELAYGGTASKWQWANPADSIPAYSTVIFKLKVKAAHGVEER